jgi:hypothetical protein
MTPSVPKPHPEKQSMTLNARPSPMPLRSCARAGFVASLRSDQGAHLRGFKQAPPGMPLSRVR